MLNLCRLAGTIAAGLFLAFAGPAQAHFQLIYTPVVTLARPNIVPVKLIFWHPFQNGAVMDMAPPEQFYILHRGQKTDLLGALKPIVFQGLETKGAAFEAAVPVKRMGDHIMVLVPAPYLEVSEGVFIQQFTKSFLNLGGVPSGWNDAVGLPAEIIPLNKPTNILAGSTFSGRVMAEGQPVAGAEVEVEFVAAEPNLQTNRPHPATVVPPPGGAVVAVTDAGGVFTFGVPRAGVWGFAALGVGPQKTREGKRLSQDAVLWIRAHDLAP